MVASKKKPVKISSSKAKLAATKAKLEKLAATAILAAKRSQKYPSFRVIHNSEDYYVIEYKPQCRNVFIEGDWYDGDDDDDDSYYINNYINRSFYLSFPYVQFSFRGDNVGVTFSNKSVKRLDSPVHIPFLPNFASNAMFCFGSMRERIDEDWQSEDGEYYDDLPLVKRAPHMVRAFWNSTFILDGSNDAGIDDLKDSSLKTFEVWEKKSKNNPKFILRQKFGPSIKLPFSAQYLYYKKQGRKKR